MKAAEHANAAVATQRDEQVKARKAAEADLSKVREAAETLREVPVWRVAADSV